jgi:hypothetical protein
METVTSVLPSEVTDKLPNHFTTERFLNKTVYYELLTNDSRIATSWLSKPLMIGGQQLAETLARGQQFTPAIVHWAANPSHKPRPFNGLFSLYPTATMITAVAESHSLIIIYPNMTQAGTDSCQFMLSRIPLRGTWPEHRGRVLQRALFEG